ncbi:g3758 [Coccomyxa elongata]
MVFKATSSSSPTHTDIQTTGWKEKTPKFLAVMFLLGATVGPAVDGIHGQLTYDSAPMTLGSLHTSAWVFGLLGAFYATLGPCFVALDSLTLRQGGSTETTDDQGEAQPVSLAGPMRRWSVTATQRAVSRADAPRAALSLGVVAALHQLSCVLYTAGVPYGQISAVLAATAVLNWLLFDGTPQGLVLASLCAVGAPTSELLLMKLCGVWHYDKPDFLVAGVGLPSWVACCYFFYMPWLANAARALWKRL